MEYSREFTAKNLGRRNGTQVQFIVLHDTAGNGGLGDVKYLANDPEKRGVSVDFAVPKDGKVYQLNPDLITKHTFHAGRKTQFRGYMGQRVNQASIGIEIGQKAVIRDLTVLYPTVQVDAVVALCKDLCHKFNLTKTDITTHAKIITDGSRSDPRQWPWEEFWDKFNGVSAADGEPIYHIVKKGDTLYQLSTLYLTSVESIKEMNGMNKMSNVIKVGQKLQVKK